MVNEDLVMKRLLEAAGTARDLGETPWGKAPSPKAHDNIDREIDKSTIQSIMHGRDWGGGSILYKALTKGGDPRHILRHTSTMPTKEVRDVDYYNLIRKITQNPQFADTLKSEDYQDYTGDIREADRPSLLARLIDRIKSKF